MQSHFPQMQIQEKGFPKSRNLVLGDPESAKAVLCAHYDTCAQLPFPNFIMPKRPILSVGYSLIILIPLFLLVFLVNKFLHSQGADKNLRMAVNLAVYWVFLMVLMGGAPNKHTANDNTSGVITLVETYEQMTEAQRQQVCFVFFDNEELGLFGSSQFRKKYKSQMKETLLINFDCVSDGDTFLLGISKNANRKYHIPLVRAYPAAAGKNVLFENLKKIYYPSDQAGFPTAIAVASLKYKEPFGYYMDRIHTKRDTVFQEENIAYLAHHTIDFLDSIT